MSIEEEIERLSQAKNVESFQCERKMTDMITVYQNSDDHSKDHHYCLYAALIPFDEKETALSKFTWNLMQGAGVPVYEKYMDGETEYLRFGNYDEIEPLVIHRDFNEIRPSYREISEEFRLYHNLYFDRKNSVYLKIDDGGNETIIATVEEDVIKIRLLELREFITIKDMYLSIQFDFKEHSYVPLTKLGIIEGSGEDEITDEMCWCCHYGESYGWSDFPAFSRLCGKFLISPMSKDVFEDGSLKQYVDFIIEIDDFGKDVTHTCNPDELANMFGNSPDSLNYLTPVTFRKTVLEKYYQEPSKYSVKDSNLSCGSLWGLTLDNHDDEKISVWLGDLGRDLSFEEQHHWRAHNISSSEGVSETYFQRQILALFTSSERTEDLFESKYKKLQSVCDEHLGWQLLLSLDADDMHHFNCLRVPVTNEQRDFDAVVLSLTKILIDSFNERKLSGYIDPNQKNSVKGSIGRLEKVFQITDLKDFGVHISFLRSLQNLRSSSSAHRKGSGYKKIARQFGVDENDLKSIFSGILVNASVLLDFLIDFVEKYLAVQKMVTQS